MKTLAMVFFPTPFSGEAAQYELGMHRLPFLLEGWDQVWLELAPGRAGDDAVTVAGARPDLVLLHAHRTQVAGALAFAEAFGAVRPDVPLVMCGWTAHPPYVDGVMAATEPLTSPAFALACGEVEAVIPPLAERLAARAGPAGIEEVPGLVRWDPLERRWRGAPRYVFVEDLDRLPDVSIEHIPKAWKQDMAGWLELARGCRFRCSFCLACAFPTPGLRRFGPERIREGVRRSVDAGVSVLGLLTSSNSFDAELLRSLVGAFSDLGVKGIGVAGPMHAKYVRGEVLDLLRTLDWRLMTIGLQTITGEAQRLIRRGDDPAELAATLERIATFATPEIEIILGLPGDSPAGFRRTVEYLLALPVNITVHTLRLDPWSTFLMERERFGIVADFVGGARVVSHDSFSLEQMDECRAFLRELAAGPWTFRAGQLALDGEHLNRKR